MRGSRTGAPAFFGASFATILVFSSDFATSPYAPPQRKETNKNSRANKTKNQTTRKQGTKNQTTKRTGKRQGKGITKQPEAENQARKPGSLEGPSLGKNPNAKPKPTHLNTPTDEHTPKLNATRAPKFQSPNPATPTKQGQSKSKLSPSSNSAKCL